MSIKIKSEKRQNIQVILDKLKDVDTYENGGISFHGAFEFTHLKWMLLSIIDFGVNLAPSSKDKIASSSLLEIKKNSYYDIDSLKSVLNTNFSEHMKQSKREYFLLGTISATNLPIRKIKYDNSIIVINKKNFGPLFAQKRKTFLQRNQMNPDLEEFSKITVRLESKNLQDAYLEGIEKFEVLRSFLCLIVNKGNEIRYGNNDFKPINLISSGEVFTLHYNDGANVDPHLCWVADNYKTNPSISLNEVKIQNVKSKIPSIYKKLNAANAKTRILIQKALNVYVTAFDENDKYICLLKAWTVLEILFRSENYDELIKRITSIFHRDDQAFVKQDLQCLREYRNEFVHSGSRNHNPLVACYRLQKYIRVAINYHLRFTPKFENIGQSLEFLDLYGLDNQNLENRRKMIDIALNIKEKK